MDIINDESLKVLKLYYKIYFNEKKLFIIKII